MTDEQGISRRSFVKGIGALAAVASVPAWPHLATATKAAPGRLRFGVQTAPQHTTYDAIEAVWKEADGLGYDSAFVFDHFIPILSDPSGPCLEGWTLLAALAAKTESVQVGVLVTGNTYRYPAVLAKMAATVDHVSHGRLILGLGAGWFELEHTAYGIPFSTAGGRARQLVESVEVIKMLFKQQRSTFAGKYYRLQDAPFEPKGVQRPHPPILIGGMGPKVIQPLAARHADIWHFFVRAGSAESAKQICSNFDAICRTVGRNPAEVEKSTTVRADAWSAETAAALRTEIKGLVDAGVRHIILGLRAPFDLAVLRGFAREVIPEVRAAQPASSD
jgi:F420-dependent oxidoreductase-like protein